MSAETHQLSKLLLPELEAELGKTRRALEGIPEGQNDFKPRQKSKSLIELANHLATVAGLAGPILSSPSVDLGGPSDPRRIVREQSVGPILTLFDQLAEGSIAHMRATSDVVFAETWEASQQGRVLFSGSRYMAYRNIAINHMIHHRAQLGSYLRLLDIAVPGTYGPSADDSPARRSAS